MFPSMRTSSTISCSIHSSFAISNDVSSHEQRVCGLAPTAYVVPVGPGAAIGAMSDSDRQRTDLDCERYDVS